MAVVEYLNSNPDVGTSELMRNTVYNYRTLKKVLTFLKSHDMVSSKVRPIASEAMRVQRRKKIREGMEVRTRYLYRLTDEGYKVVMLWKDFLAGLNRVHSIITTS